MSRCLSLLTPFYHCPGLCVLLLLWLWLLLLRLPLLLLPPSSPCPSAC